MSAPFDIKKVEDAFCAGIAAFKVLPPLLCDKWSEKNFRMTRAATGQVGEWKCYAYQRALLNWMTSDDIEIFSFMKPKRIGYTKCLIIAAFYYIVRKFRNIAIWQPSDGDAVAFVKTQINPSMAAVPAVNELIAGGSEKRSSDNTMDVKLFKNGVALDIKGGKSPKNYRAMTKDVGIYDELAAFDLDIGGEGSPTKLGDGRLDQATFPKSIRGSTPQTKGICLIEKSISTADMVFYRFLPCPHCGVMQKLEFSQLKVKESQENTPYICKYNGCVIYYKDYKKMDDGGRWQTDDGNWYDEDKDMFFNEENKRIMAPRHLGAHIWGGYSRNRSWSFYAREWIQVNIKAQSGDLTELKTFVAETWEEKGDKVEHGQFSGDRLDDYTPDMIPDEVLMVTIGADVQGGKNSRIELEILGWGLGAESWSLDYVVIPGDPERDDIWSHLDDQFLRKFVRQDGTVLGVAGGMIDSGYLPSRVFDFTRPRKRRNIYATKGKAQYSGPLLGKGSWQGEKGKKTLQFPINTDEAKETVFNRLNKIPSPGPGYCHFPKHYTAEYFKMLTNEEKRVDRKSGVVVGHKWIKLGPNEPLDCRTGNLAAFARLNPNLANIAQHYRQTAEHTRLDLPKQSTTLRPGRRVRSTGVTG